jgi:hypothetical protein
LNRAGETVSPASDLERVEVAVHNLYEYINKHNTIDRNYEHARRRLTGAGIWDAGPQLQHFAREMERGGRARARPIQLAGVRPGDELVMLLRSDVAGAAAVLDGSKACPASRRANVDQAGRDVGAAAGQKAPAGFAAAMRNASIGRGTRG